jgi:DNA-directed RNA polymerase III subunit RPC4
MNASTQPSFYQEAVYTDSEKQRLCAIGEVSKRFTISPDVDALLHAMEEKEANELAELNRKVSTGDGMYTMDTT